jgi:hypothetical protein
MQLAGDPFYPQRRKTGARFGAHPVELSTDEFVLVTIKLN